MLTFAGRSRRVKKTMKGWHQIVNVWISEMFRFAVASLVVNEMVIFSDPVYLLSGTVGLLQHSLIIRKYMIN